MRAVAMMLLGGVMGACSSGTLEFTNANNYTYQSNIAIASMTLAEAAAIIGTGIFLGLFGSWFTAARHMRRIEPR